MFSLKNIKEKPIETIVIAKLLNINPFNQPAVEKVKIYTKKYLLK